MGLFWLIFLVGHSLSWLGWNKAVRKGVVSGSWLLMVKPYPGSTGWTGSGAGYKASKPTSSKDPPLKAPSQGVQPCEIKRSNVSPWGYFTYKPQMSTEMLWIPLLPDFCFKKSQVTSRVLPPLEYSSTLVPKYENENSFMNSTCSILTCFISLVILSRPDFGIHLK